jgi:hypothetical protein
MQAETFDEFFYGVLQARASRHKKNEIEDIVSSSWVQSKKNKDI